MVITTPIILLLVLVVLCVACFPTWPYSSGFGWGPSRLLGLLLVIILVLAILGKL